MLSDLSEKYIEETSIEHRKKLGQYFTNQKICQEVLKFLPEMNNLDVLEPSCGSGEFLSAIYSKYPDSKIDAFEIDEKLGLETQKSFPNVKFKFEDTLLFDFKKQYDLIIGNPPYFQFTPNKGLSEKYGKFMSGRPNIYGYFIGCCLQLLKPEGYLAFVVPPSMNNGAYFKPLRKFIQAGFNIVKIKTLTDDNFEGANQTVMLLIIQRGKNDGEFIFERNGQLIFTEFKNELENEFSNRKSLKELGYKVKTGPVVWNQHKKDLSNNEVNSIPLIWSENIEDEIIKLNVNHKNGQFILKSSLERQAIYSENCIVVNRITGSPNNPHLRSALVDLKEWTSENHTNIIYKTDGIVSLKEIQKQLCLPRTNNVIKYITGNTQISKTELENLIPFDEI
jgi:adenine-specific DNA-methyltransferase